MEWHVLAYGIPGLISLFVGRAATDFKTPRGEEPSPRISLEASTGIHFRFVLNEKKEET